MVNGLKSVAVLRAARVERLSMLTLDISGDAFLNSHVKVGNAPLWPECGGAAPTPYEISAFVFSSRHLPFVSAPIVERNCSPAARISSFNLSSHDFEQLCWIRANRLLQHSSLGFGWRGLYTKVFLSSFSAGDLELSPSRARAPISRTFARSNMMAIPSILHPDPFPPVSRWSSGNLPCSEENPEGLLRLLLTF